jgi:hypothetical protein
LAGVTRVPRALLTAGVAVLLLAGCHGSTKPAGVAPTTVSTANGSASTVAGASTSSTIAIQTSGARTVLSPVGLNLRATPSKSGAVVGTAGQGATLTVLSHTDAGGGWYQVKGATVTGYITDNPVLSAEGKFTAYSSSPINFSALYPETWMATEAPPASVVFHPGTGSDSIVVTGAATASQLKRGRGGYHQDSSDTIVVCGVTGQLVILEQAPGSTAASTPPATVAGGVVSERYLVQIRLTLDAQHALGVDANLGDLAQLTTAKSVIYSISFPFPQCEQGTSPNTSSTAPATTIH